MNKAALLFVKYFHKEKILLLLLLLEAFFFSFSFYLKLINNNNNYNTNIERYLNNTHFNAAVKNLT